MKQAVGALGSAVSPALPTVTKGLIPSILSTKKVIYDVTSAINERLVYILSDYVIQDEGRALEIAENRVRKIIQGLRAGKKIKNKDLLGRILADTTDVWIKMNETITDIANISPENEEMQSEFENSLANYFDGWESPADECDEVVQDFCKNIIPGDIYYEGKLIASKESLLKSGFFHPEEAVIDNLQEISGEIEDNATENIKLAPEEEKWKEKRQKEWEKEAIDTHLGSSHYNQPRLPARKQPFYADDEEEVN